MGGPSVWDSGLRVADAGKPTRASRRPGSPLDGPPAPPGTWALREADAVGTAGSCPHSEWSKRLARPPRILPSFPYEVSGPAVPTGIARGHHGSCGQVWVPENGDESAGLLFSVVRLQAGPDGVTTLPVLARLAVEMGGEEAWTMLT